MTRVIVLVALLAVGCKPASTPEAEAKARPSGGPRASGGPVDDELALRQHEADGLALEVWFTTTQSDACLVYRDELGAAMKREPLNEAGESPIQWEQRRRLAAFQSLFAQAEAAKAAAKLTGARAKGRLSELLARYPLVRQPDLASVQAPWDSRLDAWSRTVRETMSKKAATDWAARKKEPTDTDEAVRLILLVPLETDLAKELFARYRPQFVKSSPAAR